MSLSLILSTTSSLVTLNTTTLTQPRVSASQRFTHHFVRTRAALIHLTFALLLILFPNLRFTFAQAQVL